MTESHAFSFQQVSKNYGTTAQDLAAAQIISERKAELVDNCKVKAIRLSTLSKICDAIGCLPGDFFVASSFENERPTDNV